MTKKYGIPPNMIFALQFDPGIAGCGDDYIAPSMTARIITTMAEATPYEQVWTSTELWRNSKLAKSVAYKLKLNGSEDLFDELGFTPTVAPLGQTQ